MAFAPRHHEQAAEFCRALVERIDWSPVILDRWPMPLAFEYWRLRAELQRGQLLAAMVQLKDCAEVLVKLVVSIAGRLLIEQGNARQRAEARRFLLARKPPSLGDWVQEGVKLVEAAYRLAEDLWQPWASVLGLLRKAGRKPQPTLLWQELVNLVGWRNEELGHNALRLDMLDFTDDLNERLTAFSARLVAHAAAWDGIALAVGTDADWTLMLTGHSALEAAQPALLEHLSARALVPLRLDRGDHTLWLGPYICLRRHSRDAEIGCYVLNKRIGKRSQALLSLLDYRTGDTDLAGHAAGEPSLIAELDSLPEEAETSGGDDAPVGDLGDDEVRDFLDGISFQREYVAPEYLRRVLRDFLDPAARERGLFWLCAPADVGKTLFAYGLATRGSLREVLGGEQPAPLWDDLEAIVVAIRREYRCTPAALSSDVQFALGRSGDKSFLSLERFLYDEAFKGDRPGAFCAWLERMRNEATAHLGPSARFLLVLDGLDELPPLDETVEGGSITELLPPAGRLPERVFLLLTSRGRDPARPADDCPTAVYTALDNAFAASTDALRARYALDPRTDAEYRTVLRTFFEQRLTSLYPQETERAALFERVLEHGEHRFKSLSYYTALLASGAIGPVDLAELSAEPLQQHLAALETWEPPRKFALIRRILLELAAAEQAHRAEIALMEPAPVIDRTWLGLDLLELAWRVGYPTTRSRELDPRFLTALYSIQELIRSYRGAAATTSRFALGLKGMVEQLETLEGWETPETLKRLANEAFGDCQAANDETAETAALIRAGGPIAALVADGLRLPCWNAVKNAYWTCVNRAETYQQQCRTVEALRLSITAQSLAELAAHPDESEDRQAELNNCTAGAMMTRGDVRQTRGDLSGALADYGQAIELREALRRQLGAEWPPAWANDLAGVYISRGITRDNGGDRTGALADFDRAVELRENLCAQLEFRGEWPPAWANNLAMAYMNRGVTRHDGGDLGGSLADYDRAIVLMESLRTRLEPRGEWSPVWAISLAGAYMNRGNARRDGGDLGGSLADCDRAIALIDAVWERLEPRGEWPLAWANDLAAAYLNRGVTRDYGDRTGALADYDRAIALMEGLRMRLEPRGEWPPAWANNLAIAYGSRGNACRDGGDRTEALADYDRAIALMEGLRTRLEPRGEWPPAWANDLARTYGSRGYARDIGGDRTEALADYDRAIALMEGLRTRLEPRDEWPPAWANNLARTYGSRGNACRGGGDRTEALADYDRAIALMDAVLERQEPRGEWPPAWANNLAIAYMNRGYARDIGGDRTEVLADYDRAIALMEGLRMWQEPRGEWPPAWANNLAWTYGSRGIVHKRTGHLAKAVADWDWEVGINWTLIQKGELTAGTSLLKVLARLFDCYRDLADWPSAAQHLLAFMASHQQLEALWAEWHGETEPPWREIVGQFAGTVQGLNPDQRAALLAALGEKAEAVKQAFGWT